MIDYNIIEKKITTGDDVEVIKTKQRKVNGVPVRIVKYNEKLYKLCTGCMFYKLLEAFTEPHAKCKECRNEKYKESYANNLEYYIYSRWRAIIQKSPDEKCSLEDFTLFFKSEKCHYTNRTLLDDFLQPHLNKMLRLEIDHKKPVYEGGTSVIENLHVIPHFINRAKRHATSKEWREALEVFKNSF